MQHEGVSVTVICRFDFLLGGFVFFLIYFGFTLNISELTVLEKISEIMLV